MAKFIEADVIQKIATEAEWLTQTRIPYKGQIMIVSDSVGKVTNIKVGDGVSPFADLNYMFDSIQQNAQYVPITSNTLPTPAADPAWGMVAEGTYTFGGSDVFTVPDGHWGIANYSSGAWSLVDMGELPQTPADGVVSLGDNRATSGDTVFKSLSPISASIIGGVFPVGDSDFSSYTTNNTQEYTFLLRQFPMPQNGSVNKIRANFHRAGDLIIYILRPTGVSEQQFEYVYSINETATLGYNEFTVDIPVVSGDLVGIGQLIGGALLTTKTETSGLWLDSNPSRSVGSIVNFSNSNRAPAIGFDILVDGISDEVDAVNSRVDDLELEVASSMKESDLTIERSLNMFDPSKIVDGRYISSTGSVATVPGWQLILINIEDLEDGQDITFNGINPSMPSYYGFYTTDNGSEIASENLIPGSNGTFSSNPVTVQKPTGSVSFGITIKRPANTESVYANAVINLGDTPIPYQPYSGDVIVKYKDLKFAGGGGGEAYDQSLNTTDNVEFNSVTTHALLAELPEGAGSPPSGVLIGQAWIDTTDDSIKVRRS